MKVDFLLSVEVAVCSMVFGVIPVHFQQGFGGHLQNIIINLYIDIWIITNQIFSDTTDPILMGLVFVV